MKRIFLMSTLILLIAGAHAQEAQTPDSIDTTTKKENKFVNAMNTVGDAIVKWDTETTLDSLDQEKLPKLVTGGLFIGGNMSDFLITRAKYGTIASHRRFGAEIGGFIDFALTKHFAIQPQVIFTAHQNYFAATDTTNGLWSFGMEVPVYFLGRFGNMQKGYAQFGGGIFTHFTFASNISRYKNADETSQSQASTANPLPARYAEENEDYSRLYSLHNNHFGICATAGYEFPIGIQINFHYKVSLSDIAGFYSEMKGQKIADAVIYPQAISLGIGYRWK